MSDAGLINPAHSIRSSCKLVEENNALKAQMIMRSEILF